MGSNTSDEILLTIAIPTFNRAKILRNSLGKLLEQVSKSDSSKIEVIVSDNNSTDETKNVIEEIFNRHSYLNLKPFYQSSNTGYFGNFKKCRELSTGKYFWLLSDNELITDGVIDFILPVLLQDDSPGVCFLAGKPENIKLDELFQDDEIKFDEFVNTDKAFLATLISCVIILNDKSFDENVFNLYEGNSFLGFLFVANALRKNRNMVRIFGETFTSIPCIVYFNVFESWTKHINECLDYYIDSEIMDTNLREKFTDCFLRNVIYFHVRSYLIYGELYGKTYGSSGELRELLNSFYSNEKYYKSSVLPLFDRSRLSLKLEMFRSRLINKFRKIYA